MPLSPPVIVVRELKHVDRCGVARFLRLARTGLQGQLCFAWRSVHVLAQEPSTVPCAAMVSRSAPAIKKQLSSCKSSAAKPKVRLEMEAGALKDGGFNATLKHPSCVIGSVPTRFDWHEFTLHIINEQSCLARTWDDGHGGHGGHGIRRT